ncbi:peptidase M15 [Pseudomonas sp. 15A4]|uniref:D-Ala-D-Ala carboxypeptidase family metallohydrolase n=1 Tax=Pseudomonas sp. 15A4 TaxID=2804761 RepID=UPI0019686817|nr:D-Ala-D-Ala carboxypeptidase family metallohydrolase [Pseudomonas sp. 15A4]QSB20622.1 peptidase M15 [Pseudomonas sp. 15A4]
MAERTWLHFTPAELRCKCGQCSSDGSEMNSELMAELETLREQFGHPIALSSAFRCARHPVEAGKANPGEHTAGLAVDVRCSGAGAVQILRLAMNLKFTRFGVSQRGAARFIHLGMAPIGGRLPSPTIWSY